MRKIKYPVMGMLLLTLAFRVGGVVLQREMLNEKLIRMHVVASSDSREDQAVKLQVRDAVNGYLAENMRDIHTAEEAKACLRDNLDEIRRVANNTLAAAGREEQAVVTLRQEAFPTRQYDTFSLPAGVYDSLRITIGQGGGKNWWCVVFPTLCIPASSEGFEDVAAGAGFPDALTAALEGKDGYEIRFFLLDWLGRMENMLFEG